MKISNIYITGINGFIGKHLAAKLDRLGYGVFGCDIFMDTSDHRPADIVDISTDTHFDRYLISNEIDVVIHTAGRPSIFRAERFPVDDFKVHVTGTVNVLEGARLSKTTRKVIFLSSGEVYRLPNKLAEIEEPNPSNIYGFNKLTAESYIRKFSEKFGLKYSILRPSAIYGPGAKKGVPFDLTNPYVTGEDEVILFTSPDSVIDYIYIDDVIDGIVASLSSEWDMQIANIVSDDPFRVGDAYKWVCEYTGKSIPLRMTPESANVANRTLKNGKALELGWQPGYSWQDGFAKLLEYKK